MPWGIWTSTAAKNLNDIAVYGTASRSGQHLAATTKLGDVVVSNDSGTSWSAPMTHDKSRVAGSHTSSSWVAAGDSGVVERRARLASPHAPDPAPLLEYALPLDLFPKGVADACYDPDGSPWLVGGDHWIIQTHHSAGNIDYERFTFGLGCLKLAISRPTDGRSYPYKLWGIFTNKELWCTDAVNTWGPTPFSGLHDIACRSDGSVIYCDSLGCVFSTADGLVAHELNTYGIRNLSAKEPEECWAVDEAGQLWHYYPESTHPHQLIAASAYGMTWDPTKERYPTAGTTGNIIIGSRILLSIRGDHWWPDHPVLVEAVRTRDGRPLETAYSLIRTDSQGSFVHKLFQFEFTDSEIGYSVTDGRRGNGALGLHWDGARAQ